MLDSTKPKSLINKSKPSSPPQKVCLVFSQPGRALIGGPNEEAGAVIRVDRYQDFNPDGTIKDKDAAKWAPLKRLSSGADLTLVGHCHKGSDNLYSDRWAYRINLFGLLGRGIPFTRSLFRRTFHVGRVANVIKLIENPEVRKDIEERSMINETTPNDDKNIAPNQNNHNKLPGLTEKVVNVDSKKNNPDEKPPILNIQILGCHAGSAGENDPNNTEKSFANKLATELTIKEEAAFEVSAFTKIKNWLTKKKQVKANGDKKNITVELSDIKTENKPAPVELKPLPKNDKPPYRYNISAPKHIIAISKSKNNKDFYDVRCVKGWKGTLTTAILAFSDLGYWAILAGLIAVFIVPPIGVGLIVGGLGLKLLGLAACSAISQSCPLLTDSEADNTYLSIHDGNKIIAGKDHLHGPRSSLHNTQSIAQRITTPPDTGLSQSPAVENNITPIEPVTGNNNARVNPNVFLPIPNNNIPNSTPPEEPVQQVTGPIN